MGFFPSRLIVKNLADQPEDVNSPFPRGDVKLDTVGEQDKPDLIAVSNCAKRQQTSDFGRQFSLAGVHTTVTTRRTDIDQEHDGQFAFLDIFPDVRFTHPGRHVPIDRTDFVAEVVLTEIIEINAAPFKKPVVLNRKGCFDETAGSEFQLADLFQDLRYRLHRFISWNRKTGEDSLNNCLAGDFFG